MRGKFILQIILSGLIFVSAASAAFGQTTAFTYQGRLTDSGASQSIYQMEFRLYGSPAGSDQIGVPIANPGVAVNQGVFSVLLDFGASVFTGADRFLQISVRRSAGESYTILNPRQQITSSPFSVRTLSAAQADIALDSNKLGGIDANQYLTSANVGNSFIKNSTAQQTGNFNLSGGGTLGGILQANRVTALTGTGFYGLVQTDGTTSVGTYVGGSTSGAAGGWFGTLTNDALHFFTNGGQPQLTITGAGNVGVGTINPRAKLDISGNVVQDRDRGGIIKAAIYVAGNGTLVRCYNGIVGASSGNCGFSVTRAGAGFYQINFGFQISDRFISVTTSSNAIVGNVNTSAQVGFDLRNPNTFLTVRTFAAGDVQLLNDSDFFITVY